ncbi:efflux RND transporter periplasmic adaptor subunit [Thalassotalea euphylliae]|uniref:Efflux RND transporter periplasmic adaptor subunit n=1 Tax=Thalassotalea euphylliae TaxID=1655234 RepID=A0A3E0UI55_9GAMM|nr:efflux RND transporter periplasmic adaptor subunit [Thalassotalea euphylliae]REL36303.1 efflux RND transporter periplasmic adaptor subunit [Thalassotalea euphylliae]
MKFYNQIALVLLALVTIAGCTPAPTPQVQPIRVSVETIPEISNEKLQTFPAVVHASELTQLSFQLNGEVNELIATEGMEVKKGELLAKLDDTLLVLAVSEAKAKVELSKVQAARAKQMVDRGNMPESTYDELLARYEIALARYNYAQSQLDYVYLRAPFDGIISDVAIERFQATTVGRPIITMHKLDMVEVRIDMPDILVASADQQKVDGQQHTVDVKLDAYPNQIFKAEYKEHTTEQNEENRSFTLVLEMPSTQAKPVIQGMPGSISLDLAQIERDSAYYSVVPLHAVVLPDSYSSSSFTSIIWRLNGTQVEPVEVTLGRLVDKSHVEVIGDIKPGDKVITKGLHYLRRGTEVIVAEKEA